MESEGLGWHSRSFSDVYDMCGTADGAFVTLFHTKKKEPLEKMDKAFFGRRWNSLDPDSFKSLAVSRFLAASIVGQSGARPDHAARRASQLAARVVPGRGLRDFGARAWSDGINAQCERAQACACPTNEVRGAA